ncbi:MAG: ABC transporter substrate-binding protein [Brevinema sp.]
MATFIKFLLPLMLAIGLFLPEWAAKPHQVSSKKNIQRIIALSPAETQNLAYLGLDDRIIAVSAFDELPSVQHLPKLLGITVTDEDILRLNPDMLAVSETSAFDHLKPRNIIIYSGKTGGLQAVYSNLRMLEDIFELSSQKSQQYLEDLARYQQNITPRGRYLMVIGVDPIYTVSTNTFLSELLALAGWKNAVELSPPYPVLDEESLRGLNADVLFVPLVLVEETTALEKIRQSIGASRIVALSNNNLMLPSPLILKEVAMLKNI